EQLAGIARLASVFVAVPPCGEIAACERVAHSRSRFVIQTRRRDAYVARPQFARRAYHDVPDRRGVHNVASGPFRPSGNAASITATSLASRVRSPAPALSSTCATLAALGIVNAFACRVRNARTTWRAVAPCLRAMVSSAVPAGVEACGKRARPN